MDRFTAIGIVLIAVNAAVGHHPPLRTPGPVMEGQRTLAQCVGAFLQIAVLVVGLRGPQSQSVRVDHGFEEAAKQVITVGGDVLPAAGRLLQHAPLRVVIPG